MPEEKRYHLVGPILLIAIGFVLLLSQLGIWDIPWGELWRWWPLALVIGGLNLVLSRSRAGQIAMVVIVILVAAAMIVLIPGGVAMRGERMVTESFSQPVNGATSARVRLDMGIGHLEVGSLDAVDQLVEAEVRYDSRRATFQGQAEPQGDGVEVRLASQYRGSRRIYGDSGDRWDVLINPSVPVRLDIEGGVNRANLDLADLTLTRLDLGVGVGDVTLTLPGSTRYRARIDGGVGLLEIETPADAPVRIRVDGGLGSLDIASHFRREGSYYVSPAYSDAAEAIEIDIDAGVGSLKIR